MNNIAVKSRMDQAHAKRYAIQPHDGGDFYTGLAANTDQELMGLLCPNLVALFFDVEGNLLRADQRPVPFFQGVNPPFHIYDKRIRPLIEAWQDVRETSFEFSNLASSASPRAFTVNRSVLVP